MGILVLRLADKLGGQVWLISIFCWNVSTPLLPISLINQAYIVLKCTFCFKYDGVFSRGGVFCFTTIFQTCQESFKSTFIWYLMSFYEFNGLAKRSFFIQYFLNCPFHWAIISISKSFHFSNYNKDTLLIFSF